MVPVNRGTAVTDFNNAKTILAKLLAQENIRVVHRKVQTAAFDLGSRTLILPIFKDMTGDIYDGLIGHEVSHALNTPLEGWHNAVTESKSLKSYLNVVEDARIERMIKEKFPGLRHSFVRMYKEFHDRDFFHLQGVNVDKLRLIDRINIFFKLGAHVRVAFTPEELVFIDRITAAQTWDDVEQIARDLHKKAKEDYKKNPEQQQSVRRSMDDLSQDQDDEDLDQDVEYDDSEEEEADGGDPDDYSNSDEDSDENSGENSDESEDGKSETSSDTDDSDTGEDESEESESDSTDADEEGDEGDGDESEAGPGGDEEGDDSDGDSDDDGEDGSAGDDDGDDENDEGDVSSGRGDGDDAGNDDEVSDEEADEAVGSDTDDAFRESQGELVEFDKNEPIICYLPEIKNYLVPHKNVQGAISTHINSLSETNRNRIDKLMEGKVLEFVRRVSPMVNYMVKEFEMRKNATQLARTRTAKSGKINPAKLARYSLDSDIFQRLQSIPEGQNHGLVMFIDLSSSMVTAINDTFEQVLVMTQFCKKLNIPYEVYGFSDDYRGAGIFKIGKTLDEKTPNTIRVHGSAGIFYIKQYLSSSMSIPEYRTAMYNMLFVGSLYSKNNAHKAALLPPTETLFCTPLDAAVIASIDLVSQFKSKHNASIVNTIFLTDGCGGVSNEYIDANGSRLFANTENNKHHTPVIIEDRKTGYRVKYRNEARGYRADNFISTRAFVELAQMITGAKYTGYMMQSKKDIASFVVPYECGYDNHKNHLDNKKSMRNRVEDEGFISSNKFGFYHYFFVIKENIGIDDDGLDVDVGAAKGKIARAFSTKMNKRAMQRMFLNEFMETIAKA